MVTGIQVETINTVRRGSIQCTRVGQAVDGRPVCLEVAAALLIADGQAREMWNDFRPANAERVGVSVGDVIRQSRYRVVAAAVIRSAIVDPTRKMAARKNIGGFAGNAGGGDWNGKCGFSGSG